MGWLGVIDDAGDGDRHRGSASHARGCEQHRRVGYCQHCLLGRLGGGPGYGGVSHDFSPYQDWSNYAGFSFWFKGSNTGQELRIELKTDGANPGASNRFVYAFTDNATTLAILHHPLGQLRQAHRLQSRRGPRQLENPS